MYTGVAMSHETSIDQLPPMPSRRRLSSSSWERVWWLLLHTPITSTEGVAKFSDHFNTPNLNVRAQMRTANRMCLAITSTDLDDDEVFQRTMEILAAIEDQFGAIEKIEDRPASVWPYRNFK